jgi:hypothetical protein
MVFCSIIGQDIDFIDKYSVVSSVPSRKFLDNAILGYSRFVPNALPIISIQPSSHCPTLPGLHAGRLLKETTGSKK